MTGGAARDAQAWPRGDWTPDQARGHTWEGLAEIVAPIHDGTHLIAVFRDGRLHINTDPDGCVTTTAAGRRYLGIEGGDPHVSRPNVGCAALCSGAAGQCSPRVCVFSVAPDRQATNLRTGLVLAPSNVPATD